MNNDLPVYVYVLIFTVSYALYGAIMDLRRILRCPRWEIVIPVLVGMGIIIWAAIMLVKEVRG